MNLVKVKCAFCGKEFLRKKGQYNEAKKFGWKQYCSSECLSNDRIKRLVLFCENCGKAFERTFHEISPHYNYCSKPCAAIDSNKKYPRQHLKPELKICMKCGKTFRKSTGNKKYCSIKCRREAERHTQAELLNIIRNTTQKLKRVPSRRELESVDSSCKKLFGSWNNAIVAAGFQPNRSHSQRMYKRTNTVASDGHLCDSISESLVDDWLTKNRIPHEKDVFYPGTNYKADWVVSIGNNKIFVEYFGLANDSSRYDRSIKEKRKLCRKNKISLIAIYPQDLYPKKFLEENLKNKFKKFLTA